VISIGISTSLIDFETDEQLKIPEYTASGRADSSWRPGQLSGLDSNALNWLLESWMPQ